MLTITPAAAEALDAYAGSAPEVSEAACVRIAQAVGANGQPSLAIGLAPEPAPGDAPIEADSTVPLFIEPAVADMLNDKVLDAQRDGDRIAFVVGES
jgi:hypothetical protein